MAKAFIVLQNGVVVNKIIPADPVKELADIQLEYSDPSYTVQELDSEDPAFVNSNNDKVDPGVKPVTVDKEVLS